ncbi:MAG TPA: TolC family protein [Terriglobales bacterium]
MATQPVAGFGQDSTPNAPSPQGAAQGATKNVKTSSEALTGYGSPLKHWPNPIAPYSSKRVPEPSFANTPRLDQLMKDGKIMLSLSDAVALALENNLDIAIARYNLPIADTDVLRSRAGAQIRGVNTGVVSGTPGGAGAGVSGSQGSGAGGTSAGAGGAGTGSLGIVSSTTGAGPAVEALDPTLTTTLQLEQARSPQSNTVFTGVSTLNQNTGLANFTFSKGFLTGTDLALSFNNNRQTTNSVFSTLNPILNSNFRATARQHLLQGFGISQNNRLIRIARNNREIADISFRLQVISTVSQIQNIYWNLVNAYEDVKAKERAVALAQRTLSDNRKQVEIGTLAPIEIVRAESEVAARQQDLIISQTSLQLQQLLTKNALSRNLTDPVLAAAPVIPTDTMSIPQQEPVVPIQDLLNEALSHRAELAQSRITLTNSTINIKGTRNGLLPQVDLLAFYGASALGGSQNALGTCPPGVTPSSTNRCTLPGTIPATGYGDAFGNLFNSSAPDKGIGLTVNLPIFNRSAQADHVRSQLEYRQSQMRYQQLQNQIGIEVRNAQYSLQQNRARVDAAIKGRELAQQSLDAEQKKYALGASTTFNVLQAQRDLATADSNVVASMSAYEQSRVEMDRVLGLTLDRMGIKMDEAESGLVQNPPNVQNVKPNPSATSTATQDQQQMQSLGVQPQNPQPQQTPAPPK